LWVCPSADRLIATVNAAPPSGANICSEVREQGSREVGLGYKLCLGFGGEISMTPKRAGMVALILVVMSGSTPAWCEIIRYTAALNGASETPPKPSKGAGNASVTLDTDAHTLSWRIDYSGLTGPVTMAHFHGPAEPGVAAGVVVPIPGPLVSPITGETTLSDVQIGDLRASLWYINLHTAQYLT